MVINGKTGIQLWAEQLNRGRAFMLLARIAKLLDFADSFSLLKVELRLQALDLLPLKRAARPGEAPVFTISPRIFLKVLQGPYRYQTTVLSLRQGTVPGSSRGTGTVSVLRNVSKRIQAVNRLIDKVFELKVVSSRNLPLVSVPLPAPGALETAPNPARAANRLIGAVNRLIKVVSSGGLPVVSAPKPLPASLETVPNPARAASRLIENVYRFQRVSVSSPEQEAGLSGPGPVRGTAPADRVYARRRSAALDVEDLLAASNGSRNMHNIHQLISYVFSTAGKETTGRTGAVERDIEPRQSPVFYPLQRLDIRKVDRPPETMGFTVQRQSRPEPAVLPAAVEMVTKKIKKIETQVDSGAVEQTIIRKVSEQVDRTVRQRLEKHPVSRPGETQRLEENIYSRLVNRLTLEKERVEY